MPIHLDDVLHSVNGVTGDYDQLMAAIQKKFRAGQLQLEFRRQVHAQNGGSNGHSVVEGDTQKATIDSAAVQPDDLVKKSSTGADDQTHKDATDSAVVQPAAGVKESSAAV